MTPPPQFHRRAQRIDRLASLAIRCAGTLVLLSLGAIFLFIVFEAAPLFRNAQFTPPSSAPSSNPTPIPSTPLALSFNSEESELWIAHSSPSIARFDARTLTSLPPVPLPQPIPPASFATLTQPPLWTVFLTDRGQVFPIGLATNLAIPPFEVFPNPTRPIALAAHASSPASLQIAIAPAQGAITLATLRPDLSPNLRQLVHLGADDSVQHLRFNPAGTELLALTARGQLLHWNLNAPTSAPPSRLRASDAPRTPTALEYLNGGDSLLLGYSDGTIEQWRLRAASALSDSPSFQKVRSFDPMQGAIQVFATLRRSKSFVAASASGQITLYHATTGQARASTRADVPVGLLAIGSRESRLVAAAPAQLRTWQFENPHPEVTLRSLFGNVWYSGYDQPAYVWQSSGGSDSSEPKFSLTPLILGTFKAASFGLAFAIPISLLAALYTSQFLNPRLRFAIHSAVEMLAAIPSVVLGMLASLWLAPLLGRNFPGFAAAALALPISALAAGCAFHALPTSLRNRFAPWSELAALSLATLAAGSFGFLAGPALEQTLFAGDFQQWLFDRTGRVYQLHNSMVIGFALGFSVIPVVFILAEDALTQVPASLVSGSLALGASRWQTALRIVLPLASPGILSAILIGFGRAVGETMIVLLASGNTPLLRFSPFDGMRTLTANIAVEIAEAPAGGTLYRVLFLSAALLFALTFALNTVAEWVRQRLRSKFNAF